MGNAVTELVIRPASTRDGSAIWSMLQPVFRSGDTYTIDKDICEVDALAYWLANDKETFVAELEGAVVGTYYLRQNQDGGGAHICNCGYVTDKAAVGRGVARRMCQHSIKIAEERGFRGMQFNFVVSTNVRAIGLWHSLGFETVGRVPHAFHHPEHSYVDALIMFRPINADV